MACTFREHHASLRAEFPALAPHKVLGKWLYIPQLHPEFETVATGLVELARRRDPRLGVETGVRKKRDAATEQAILQTSEETRLRPVRNLGAPSVDQPPFAVILRSAFRDEESHP